MHEENIQITKKKFLLLNAENLNHILQANTDHLELRIMFFDFDHTSQTSAIQWMFTQNNAKPFIRNEKHTHTLSDLIEFFFSLSKMKIHSNYWELVVYFTNF